MKYELTDEEVKFIKIALFHSMNITKYFGGFDPKVPVCVKETNRLIDEVLVKKPIKKLKRKVMSDTPSRNAGKGSRIRPFKKNVWDTNYDDIFRKPKKKHNESELRITVKVDENTTLEL